MCINFRQREVIQKSRQPESPFIFVTFHLIVHAPIKFQDIIPSSSQDFAYVTWLILLNSGCVFQSL